MSKFLIYGLVDPRTNEVRYIGKSSSGLRRPRCHDALARGCGSRYELRYCYRWIRKLQALKLTYGTVVIEEFDCGDWLNVREMWWIEFARAWGCRLTNLTDGGEGLLGYKFTSAQNARRSETTKKVFSTPEARARLSAACKKAHSTSEARAKHREIAKKRWATPGARAQHSEVIKKALSTPEVRARFSEARKRVYSNPDARARQGEASKRMWEKPGVCERYSEALKKMWAIPEERARRSAAIRKAYEDPQVCARRSITQKKLLEFRKQRALTQTVVNDWGCAL